MTVNFSWFFSIFMYVIVIQVSEEILKFSFKKRPGIPILAHFFDVYISLSTNRKIFFRSFWKVGQFNIICTSGDKETFEISSYKSRRKPKRHPVIWRVYISLNTVSKCDLGIILRSQPTLYDRWFSRYGKSCNFVIISPQKQKFVFFGHFRLSEGYTCLRPPIIYQALWSFWGVNQVSNTSGSRDMDFGKLWRFWVEFWPKNWVNPKNKPSKDSKTAAVSEFANLDDHPLPRLVYI